MIGTISWLWVRLWKVVRLGAAVLIGRESPGRLATVYYRVR